MLLYALTIFWSAFLLFLVQPLLGKYILPWFGGTPAVWTACLLFFQVLLLAGYSYAHGTNAWLRPRWQAGLHLLLLAGSLVMLRVVPDAAWKPVGDESPTWRIIGLLAVAIGTPYFVLSTTGPLIQSWFGRTHAGRSPYRLYALSNVGSLLALVAYPFAVEPALTLGVQANYWAWGYAVFAVVCGLCAARLAWRKDSSADDATASAAGEAMDCGGTRPALPIDAASDALRPSIADMLLWLGLAMCGSVMLLATTNQMCQDVAVVPFLWVLPLALYLLSFIICFDSPRWYLRGLFGMLLALSMILACMVLFVGMGDVTIPAGVPFPKPLKKFLDRFADLHWQTTVYAFTLFVVAMVCHGELARWKPAPRYLTLYFLLIAAGGALGGIFVALVAPWVFTGYWEYHIALVVACALALISYFRDPNWILYRGRPLYASLIFGLALGTLVFALNLQTIWGEGNTRWRARNFYGVLRVRERDDDGRTVRSLLHGRILHGFQFQDAELRDLPTSYYSEGSGVGLAIRRHPKRLAENAVDRRLNIGVVGLGVGTIASYAQKGDYLRFYEINADVVGLSGPQGQFFTYVSDAIARGATVDIVLGDARIQMEREIAENDPVKFDVLAIDAFSSDAIPMHLLTLECFRTYLARLDYLGVLAIHVSNRNVNLTGVVRGLAKECGCEASHIQVHGLTDEEREVGISESTWVLVTRNRKFLESDGVREQISPWNENDPAPIVWTDDFSSISQALIE